MMYVLDLEQVPSTRLQRILLGMQGAELIKDRKSNFTLAVSNGNMTREVILAPNLARGDVQDVTMLPLVLGRSQADATAATTLIGNFVFVHGDYGVKRVPLKDDLGPDRIALKAGSIDLAFMGIGSLDPEDPDSLFARLLTEQKLNLEELRAQGFIGNVLFHLVREKTSSAGTSWEFDDPPHGKRICVDIDDNSVGDEILHTVDVETLQQLVKVGEAQIVMMVKDPTRARIVRAALEMGCANAVICSLAVAEQLRTLLFNEQAA
jgi:hypothetical protein